MTDRFNDMIEKALSEEIFPTEIELDSMVDEIVASKGKAFRKEARGCTYEEIAQLDREDEELTVAMAQAVAVWCILDGAATGDGEAETFQELCEQLIMEAENDW